MAAKRGRARGRPIDWEGRRLKAAVLLDSLVNWDTFRFEASEAEDPRIIEAEFRRAVIERLANPGERKGITEAVEEAAERLNLTKEAVDRFVYPRRKKAGGSN